jgi:putative tryptophan/tyrosine transport system substrate-binding protein
VKRREFIKLLGGGAAAWPLAARAQQRPMALVGLLAGPQLGDLQLRGIRQGLKEAGYTEGRNIAITYRSADGHFDRLPALAAELVADGVNLILAAAPPAAAAAKRATASIPIVFVVGGDPINLGIVSSLNHPGGNITGVTFLASTLVSKRLELLRELVPGATMIGFLVNAANPTSDAQISEIQAAARGLAIDVLVLKASSERDIDAAFASFIQQRVNAVLLGSDAFFFSRRDDVVGLAARHSVPVIYYLREYAMAGGLISYGTDITDSYRLAASYVGRILKGEKPGDLPVQQSVKFELVINLKTAKALGLDVPLQLQQLADEVIE